MIARIGRTLRRGRGVVVGIGDDAAVVRAAAGRYWLLTCDLVIEGTHFRLRRGGSRLRAPDGAATFRQVGWKAVASSLSDIASMGGIPRYALVSLGLPATVPIRAVDDLYRGMRAAAHRHGVAIVGGDTNRASQVVVDVAMVGEVAPRELVLRRGARPGDRLFLTGRLWGPDPRHHLSFIPRVRAARVLATRFKPTAMIDVSDGLAVDLRRLAAASGVGAVIWEAAVPRAHPRQPMDVTLGWGEDFELLLAVRPRTADRLRLAPSRLFGVPVTEIGEVVPRRQGLRLVDRRGRPRAWPARRFEHFT